MISRHKDEYQNYIALKLNDLIANTKTYWSILKTFYFGKKHQSLLHTRLMMEPHQPFIKWRFEFSKFSQKVGFQHLPIKREGVGKIGVFF